MMLRIFALLPLANGTLVFGKRSVFSQLSTAVALTSVHCLSNPKLGGPEKPIQMFPRGVPTRHCQELLTSYGTHFFSEKLV